MPSSSVVVETPTPRETAEAFYAKGLIEYKNLNCIAANEYYRFAIDTLFKTGHTAETEYLAELTSYRWALGLSIYRHANSLYKEKEFAIASDFYALAVNELRLFFNKLANKENFWYEEYHFAAILNMYAKAHCSLGKFEQALDVTWEALEIINEIIRGSTKLFKISNKDIEKVIQLRKHMEGNLFEIIAWMKNNSQIKILHPQKLLARMEDIKKFDATSWKERKLEVFRYQVICHSSYRPHALFHPKPALKVASELPASFYPRTGVCC